VRFINNFAPHERWEDITSHRMQDLSDYLQDISPENSYEFLTKRHWFEAHPKDLPIQTINQILESSYKHRSCFIHRGEQPPHSDPDSYMRFFQEIHSTEGGNYETVLLPNYSLMLAIAQKSITNWASID
jgi:hypothetical protein